MNVRRTVAAAAVTALTAAPLVLVTAAPAQAADRDFRYAGADISFDVEKDDGRFEVEVDIDDAKPGSRWLVVLRQDGNRFVKTVLRADDEGDVEVSRDRRNTPGGDRFTLRVKRIGADRAVTRTIRTR